MQDLSRHREVKLPWQCGPGEFWWQLLAVSTVLSELQGHCADSAHLAFLAAAVPPLHQSSLRSCWLFPKPLFTELLGRRTLSLHRLC